MKPHFLIPSSKAPSLPANIFAKRSALVLHYLLLNQSRDEFFSLRDLARKTGVSPSLAQRVISELLLSGIVATRGQRTGKEFSLNAPGELLSLWLSSYQITRKCRLFNYRSGYSFEALSEKLSTLPKSKLRKPVAALHSAARMYQLSISNLQAWELYIHSDAERLFLEEHLRLEATERGYEVLLIQPYYDALVQSTSLINSPVDVSSPLLTLLELYHFPLRGEEQATFLLQRHPSLQILASELRRQTERERN